MGTTRKRMVLALTFIALVAAGGLGACGDDDEPAVEGDGADAPAPVELTVATSEYKFDVAETVASGATRLVIDNTAGAEAHQAQLFQLNPGKTVEDLAEPLADEDIGAALALGAFASGTGPTDPGATSEVDGVVDLQADTTYVLICFIPDAEGVPHVASGMIQPFAVAASEDAAAVPEGDVSIDLVDFGFEVPDGFAGGAAVTVNNTSTTQVHEVSTVRLADGKTAQDYVKWVTDPSGPPPGASIGGLQAIMPGSSAVVGMDLEAGSYAFYCVVPDPTDGKPHAAKGMLADITIE